MSSKAASVSVCLSLSLSLLVRFETRSHISQIGLTHYEVKDDLELLIPPLLLISEC